MILLSSRPDATHSLTITNASSSHGTLQLMQLVAFLGAPLVMTYTAISCWVFRAKVKLDAASY